MDSLGEYRAPARAGLLVILSTDELMADDPDAPLAVPDDCMRHLGPGHTVTLMARHNHALAMYTLGEFAIADEEAAWAADGTLEGVEDPSMRFTVGVQWHPEAGQDDALFENLVAEAKAYRAERNGR